MEEKRQIPIWFFIGAILLVYGLIIHVSGIYALFAPPPAEHRVKLYDLHADIWWGELLIIVGAFYCLRFHPFRSKPKQ